MEESKQEDKDLGMAGSENYNIFLDPKINGENKLPSTFEEESIPLFVWAYKCCYLERHSEPS